MDTAKEHQAGTPTTNPIPVQDANTPQLLSTTVAHPDDKAVHTNRDLDSTTNSHRTSTTNRNRSNNRGPTGPARHRIISTNLQVDLEGKEG